MRAYSAEAEAGNEAFMEETIVEEGYCWNSIYYGENIIQLKRSFSWFVVWLQQF